jgi:hypothetical protein
MAKRRKPSAAVLRSRAAKKGWETRRRNEAAKAAASEFKRRSESAKRGWKARRYHEFTRRVPIEPGAPSGAYRSWGTGRLTREFWKEQKERNRTGKGSPRLTDLHRELYRRLERKRKPVSTDDWVDRVTGHTDADFEEARDSFAFYH